MDSTLAEQRDYLDALHACCAARARIHAHQLIALERERALCNGAMDAQSYLASSAGCFELTRSAWLDRLANQVRVAALLDDRWSAQASLAEYAHAVGAEGHADWLACLARGAAAAGDPRRRSAASGAELARTLASLVCWHTWEPRLADHLRDAQGSYRVLLGAEPRFDAAWLRGRAFYRQRLPWDDAAHPVIAGWLAALDRPREIGPEATGPVDPLNELARLQSDWRRSLGQHHATKNRGDVPSLESFLAGYQTLAGGGTPAVAAAARRLLDAARGAASAPAALARLVRGGHLADVATASLRDRAQAALDRQSVWPDPFVAHHWRSLLAGLAQARTPTEVELVGAHAEACFAIESDWNGLWMAVALAPLRAALRFRVLGADPRAGIEAAVGVCEQLLGRGPRALLAAPRVAQFLRDNLSRVADPGAASPGARLGEAGFDLIEPVRAWVAAAAAAGEPVRLAPEHFAAEATRLLARSSAREPHAATGRWIQLWGRRAAPDACHELLCSTARPPIPELN